MVELTQTYLRKRLLYSPDTGVFYWLERPASDFATEQAWKAWNTKFAWTVAGTVNLGGYRQINLLGKIWRANRLAWLYMTGSFPAVGLDVDHIDGDSVNNKFSNLRLLTRSENNHNQQQARSDNATGVLGVCFDKARNKYIASLSYGGKLVMCKRFDTVEEAKAAYEAASKKYYPGIQAHDRQAETVQ